MSEEGKGKLSKFARSEKRAKPSKKDVEAAEKEGEAICPCGTEKVVYRCNSCGATRHLNPVSGHLAWMRNGRLVSSFHDEKDAYVSMAGKWDIPKERWPKEFL